MSEYMTVKEVAKRLRMSFQSVSRLIANGDLAAHKIGGSYRIPPEAVETMLNDTLTVKGKSDE